MQKQRRMGVGDIRNDLSRDPDPGLRMLRGSIYRHDLQNGSNYTTQKRDSLIHICVKAQAS